MASDDSGRRRGLDTYLELPVKPTDDGHTVALPLTRDEAREAIKRHVIARHTPSRVVYADDHIWEGSADVLLDAVLSAPHEVLAAAMGPDRLRELLRHVA